MYETSTVLKTFPFLDRNAPRSKPYAQYPLHHVTYAATQFEVGTTNGLGGDTITIFIPPQPFAL